MLFCQQSLLQLLSHFLSHILIGSIYLCHVDFSLVCLVMVIVTKRLMVPRRNWEPPMGAHIRLSCSARASIAVNSRDPLWNYTNVLSFVDILSKWSPHFVSICRDVLSKSIFSILLDNISWIGIYFYRGSYMLLHPWRSLFESRDEIILKGEGCDTPGVYFVLCREIYPNLRCSVRISIFLSHLSPLIKLIVKVSPISDIIRSRERPDLEPVEIFYFSARRQTR
jgi:hypothetical protein